MSPLVDLVEFRLEDAGEGLIHLVFDMPDRSMNVFSNKAIHELGRFARWLAASDVRGVVVRSGKPAFCAGADLNELGIAYDMIMATPKARRFQVAFDHFFPLSQALRALETSGKPVAAAINGLALGGGCELALGCHYRVITDDPKSAIGLPESLVGLLPGAGGTQRLPRLVGASAALPVLLDGKRLTAADALSAGAVDAVAPPGDEVAAAERWLRTRPDPRQPWDRRAAAGRLDARDAAELEAARRAVLESTRGHYPAPLAILDCLEQGLPLAMDDAIRAEMRIFAGLIQRPEPRNMIQTLFLGKLEHDRRRKAASLPPALDAFLDALAQALGSVVARATAAGHEASLVGAAAAAAGFTKVIPAAEAPVALAKAALSERTSDRMALWFEQGQMTPDQRLGADLLAASAGLAAEWAGRIAPVDRQLIDYAAIERLGFPAYLGGPFALSSYLGARPQLAA